MISKLTIRNYKSHLNTEIYLGNLTVLTGINGVGKSSVFQALLLLRQSFEKKTLDTGLDLNKPLCEIGTFADAVYQYAESDVISFEISDNALREYKWQFKPEKNALNKTFVPILGKSPDQIEHLSIFNNNFQYLSAARLSPKESYPNDTNLVEQKRQLSIEKGQGELVVHFLYFYGKEKKENIRFENLKSLFSEELDLLAQTSAWEREISPNINVVPSAKGKSFELRYSFNKPNDITSTNEFSAENVGFGVTYALPIIVALLSAEKDSLILIENPEAHLHAKGQAKLAELIALAAQNGVQVIIETHSDHIVNGLLVACKKFENEGKGINRDLVKMYYFTRDEETHSAKADEIRIQEDGKINKQPIGFFDQTQNDLGYLLGF